MLTAVRAQRSTALLELTGKAYVYDAQHECSFASDVTELALEQFRKEGLPLPSMGSSAASSDAPA